MNYYCPVCGKTEGRGVYLPAPTTHLHYDIDGERYITVPLIPIIEKEKPHAGRSTHNRRIKTAQKAARKVQGE